MADSVKIIVESNMLGYQRITIIKVEKSLFEFSDHIFEDVKTQFNPSSIWCGMSHKIWVMERPFLTGARKVVRFH